MRTIETYDQNSAGIWRTRKFDLDNPVDAVRYIARNPYAWPGGYDIILIMNDGGILCNDCVKNNYRDILFDTKNKWSTGWDAAGIDYELEESFCSHCEKID